MLLSTAFEPAQLMNPTTIVVPNVWLLLTAKSDATTNAKVLQKSGDEQRHSTIATNASPEHAFDERMTQL